MNDSDTIMPQLQSPDVKAAVGAPIARFDEGFSSDGAFLSGAETEKDATPTESEGTRTPMFELPRGERTPFATTMKKNDADDGDEPIVDSGLDHVVYSHSDEDLLKSIAAAPKETDEARTSLLMQQESFDTDFDDNTTAQSDSYKSAWSPSHFASTIGSFVKNPSNVSSYIESIYVDDGQLKREYETQAISRPRCTTPVASSVIESFIAASQQEEDEKSKLDNQKLKICLPGSGDEQQGKLKSGGRRSSKSWSEFYENMSVSTIGGRTSGRTTPLSGEMPRDDIFDTNPDYQYKVPPSPVVHRRSSTEWVNFDAAEQEVALEVNEFTVKSEESAIPAVAAAVYASIAAMTNEDSLIGSSYQTDNEMLSTYPHHELGQPEIAAESVGVNEYMYQPELDYSYYNQEMVQEDTSATNVSDSVYPMSYDNSYQENLNPIVGDYYEPDKSISQHPDAWDDDASAQPTASFYDAFPSNYDPTPLAYPSNDEPVDAYQSPIPYVSEDAYRSSNTFETPDYYSSPPSIYREPTANVYLPASTANDIMHSWNEQLTNSTFSTQDEKTYIPTNVVPNIVSGTYTSATSWDDEIPVASSYAPPVPRHTPAPELEKPKRPPAPAVSQAKSPKPEEHKKEEVIESESGESKDWLEFQKMNDRIAMAMKQTQEKLQEMKESSVSKELPNKPYEATMKDHQQKSFPENLMDMEIHEAPPTPSVADVKDESREEWKPIHERLNEEIKKQKELNKPKRPPPPKGAPARPPPPTTRKTPNQYEASWDDEDDIPPPPPALSNTFDYTSTWEDSSAAMVQPPDYVPPKQLDISALDVMEESSSSLLPPPPMDTGQLQSSISPCYFEDELPLPPPDDEDIFDVNKFAYAEKNKSDAQADVQDFFGDGTLPATKPPVPPPRSPLVERPPITQVQQGKWTDNFDSELPASESGFFQKATSGKVNGDPFSPASKKQLIDPFATLNEEENLMQDSYDPFEVKPIDVIVAEIKSKTQDVVAAQETDDDMEFFGQMNHKDENGGLSPRPPSPPLGFADEFTCEDRDEDNRTPSPLYDEDDSLPLQEFPGKCTTDGWELMLRYPVKKKIMGERYWKSVFVQLSGNTIQLYYSRNDKRPFQELPLQSNYCMSDVALQQYDVYGKIHTVKVQYVVYKERVGVRPGQIPKLVEGKLTKLGLPLEHAAQTTVLLKFGSLNGNDVQSFVYCVEDVLFKIPSARERPCMYKQDEIQVHCYDEYSAYVNKEGAVSDQRARVRLFCLAFVTGMPYIEIGLNDRRRQGKEVVRRKDIMPMYTERWIRFEALEFHSSVEKPAYDKEHVIKMRPLDATFFEVLRFRVRPPRGKELPLQVRSIMKLAGSKVEIRIEAMVASFKSRKARQVPCEDIQIRFPIPEAWIYLFREERHWGYGSVHAKVRRPGKVKNIKDRLMGMVQHVDVSLIEVAIGDAKYEHVYRSLVWRIPKLPEKHHGAYKTHLLRCRFELNSFDLMPESFIPNCEVEYTMPVATVSHTVVRSVSIEQNDDPDKVEKWVRYLAKYQYKVEVDYVQTTDLDIDAILDSSNMEPEKSLEKAPVMHKPSIDVDTSKEAHAGYRIEFAPGEFGEHHETKPKNDSSSESDDEHDSHKPPAISINMKGYGY